MYVNGTGLRAIEPQMEVSHNIIIHWIRKAAKLLRDTPEYSEIPEVAQVYDLETFVRKKLLSGCGRQ
ncbi:insertion element protein [Kalymmatonema gypsitolerans NIES-4073]|nr:insertion element protein [Scytonema sp. NIES-4073]